MKYLRKIVALAIALVLLASLIIGLGIIFAVKNVNVSLLSYSYSKDDERADKAIQKFKNSVAAEYKGRLMLSVEESGINTCVVNFSDDDGNLYILESFDKEFPCTLNVTLRERRETFYREVDGTSEVYDERGEFLREVDGEVLNKLDGAPDVLLIGTETRAKVKEIAEVCRIFSQEFSALRSVVESVELHTAISQYDTNDVIFTLRCGLLVELNDYANLTERKLSEAAKTFKSLDGEHKLYGAIYARVDDNGKVVAPYPYE